MIEIPELQGTAYFASDLHLGIPDFNSSLEREKKFVLWLDQIKKDADCLFIVGDLFDFWFEYKQVVPRGHVRVLGKLAELTDMGIIVYFFTGNHDQWIKNYFEEELGLKVFHHAQEFKIAGKTFFVGHGDGLGPGDHGYKFLKSIFRSQFARWGFARLHPNVGIALGKYWSRNNRIISGEDEEFLGEENEWLIGFCREMLKQKHYDYFIFGHRHLMLNYVLSENSRYINLGDWIKYYSYASFNGKEISLKQFELQ